MTDNPAEQFDPIQADPFDAIGESWREHLREVERERGARRERRLTLSLIGAALFASVCGLAYLIAHPPLGDPPLWLWAAALAVFAADCWTFWRFASAWGERLTAMAAMWRPWAVVGLAAYFLYYVPQGRELGGSLMIGDDHGYVLRAASLVFALGYWALNSWLSARRGVAESLNAGRLGKRPLDWPEESPRRVVTADTPWVFWGPRLVGVFAHLAAAVSLGLAAWSDLARGSGSALWWMPVLTFVAAFSAFFAVLVLIAYIYWVDRNKLSHHGVRPRRDTAAPARRPGPLVHLFNEARISVAAIGDAATKSGRHLLGLALGIVLLTALATWLVPIAWVGFVVASGAICLSAVAYLLLISASYSFDPLGVHAPRQEREDDDVEEAREVTRWTIGLVAPAILFIAAAFYDPTGLGRALGSMVVAFFAFGALLALLNVFDWATQRPDIRRTRAVRAYATAAIVGVCVVNAWITPFHRVRTLPGERAFSVDARLSVEDAAKRWYRQAKTDFLAAHPTAVADGARMPMVVVATAGGGIRAAYWTARVLDQITKDPDGLAPYIFAVSGVSGGSVGATAYATALKDWHFCENAATPSGDGLHRDCQRGEWARNLATSYLADDYLAPALTSWLFKDTFAAFLPWMSPDRAVALENGIEAASGDPMKQSFIELQHPPSPAHSPMTWSPILLLNATHEQTGRRIIASQARIDREVFVDALDELDVLGHDLRVSTAAINSARFTYVSPAGDLDSGDQGAERKGTLIDGGYFENFGALTGLEIAAAAEKKLDDFVKVQRATPTGDGTEPSPADWPEVKLVVVMITSDPDLGKTAQNRDLDPSRSLVRIDSFEDKKCLANVTERGLQHQAGENYLPYAWREPGTTLSERFADGLSEVFENSWVNEFIAPFQGLQSVRVAHGDRAATQLALQVCAEYLSQGAAYNTAYLGRDAQAAQAHAAEPKPALPYFVHVGMCRKDQLGKLSVDPPLGWVLSQSTRTGLNDLVCRCGNREEFKALETASQTQIGVEKYCELPIVRARLEAERDVKTPPRGAQAP